jgi:hypothetical protein
VQSLWWNQIRGHNGWHTWRIQTQHRKQKTENVLQVIGLIFIGLFIWK